MDIIEQIKAEIERLKGQLIRGACAAQIEMGTNCKEEAYDEVLSFLSTIESEKPMEQDGLEEEIERYLHSLGVGYGGWVDGMDDDDLRGIARHFAQWGAKQLLKSSPLPEDTVLFNKGVEEGRRLAEEEQADLFTIVALDAAQRAKEQMMKEAVKWMVDDDYHELTEKGRFILGSVGLGYNGYYIPYSDLLKLPKED